MKNLKTFEQYNEDIDPYNEERQDVEEEVWEGGYDTCRLSTAEEQEMMNRKLSNFAYNYRDICDNHVLLVSPYDDGGENIPWGRIPLDIIMDPNIHEIRDFDIQRRV